MLRIEKSRIKKLKYYIPLILVDIIRACRKGSAKFNGKYKNFSEIPVSDCSYETEEIVTKTIKRADSILESIHASTMLERRAQPILFCIFDAVIRSKKRNISIIDFGGSFGKYYHIIRKYLDSDIKLNWMIIETPSFVTKAKDMFLTEELTFFKSIEDAIETTPHIDIFFASNSLQYVESPHKILATVVNQKLQQIILTSMPMLPPGYKEDFCSIQHVTRHIYKAKYPIWLFSKLILVNTLNYYDLQAEWDIPEDRASLHGKIIIEKYKGYYFRVKDKLQ